MPPVPTAPQPTAWQTVPPEDAGFTADLGERLDAGVRSGLLRGLHAVLVVRSGRLVLERYWDGPDESWGRPLGRVAFGPDTPHDLRSVTKSIVSLLYGIALARGLVPPPEAPLFAQFPGHRDLAAADPRRARLTVAHALTMTLGTQWNEQLPYTDPANSEITMEQAPDRLRYILERPSRPIPARAGPTVAARQRSSARSSRGDRDGRCPISRARPFSDHSALRGSNGRQGVTACTRRRRACA